ncbi:203_t:CDS:2 [Ambispora gerdemannii]|uniref:203_t:CDS:1 n=1 Tax=Ambispora gerdemannii TaxID=144530 RepID=A0A9N8VZ31_9GLOM|nr:203_t:CDS:2 [Ambispora gerdemannii]
MEFALLKHGTTNNLGVFVPYGTGSRRKTTFYQVRLIDQFIRLLTSRLNTDYPESVSGQANRSIYPTVDSFLPYDDDEG